MHTGHVQGSRRFVAIVNTGFNLAVTAVFKCRGFSLAGGLGQVYDKSAPGIGLCRRKQFTYGDFAEYDSGSR